jgi:hypothetical protein
VSSEGYSKDGVAAALQTPLAGRGLFRGAINDWRHNPRPAVLGNGLSGFEIKANHTEHGTAASYSPL